MGVKDLLSKLRLSILSHNEFLPEENEYEDDDDDIEENINTSEYAEQILKNQLYSTRLYILLLHIVLIIVILVLLFNPQILVKTINNPSISTYKQLYDQYSPALTCPCSTITISYKLFVSVNYSIHPLCNFVNEEWIMSFYFPNSSYFGPKDFRSTASAQFHLIHQLCLRSQQTIIDEMIMDLGQTYLISTNLLSESEVSTTVKATAGFLRLNVPLIFLRALSLIRFTIKSGSLMSILRTNFDIDSNALQYMILTEISENNTWLCDCLFDGCTIKTDIGFLNWTDMTKLREQMYFNSSWFNNNNRVSGLVGSCTALDTVLMSNFSCFYNDTCLNLLLNYFPHLTQEMLFNASSMISQIKEIKTLSELVEQLFITNWFTSINYSEYFEQCSPKLCSYTYKDNTNILYALTKLLSLYGGITVALRIIIPYIITIIMRKRHHQQATNQLAGNNLQTFCNRITKIKLSFIKLNLFKTTNRSSNIIQQQRWTTRIYLIILLSCLSISLIFFASRKQTIVITVESPSIDTYRLLLSKTTDLSCSCSQMSINYGEFISFLPSFHQLCNSMYVEDVWIGWIIKSIQYDNPYIFDWRYTSQKTFKMLSKLCQMSNSTVISAIQQFQKQTFVSSHLLEENIFFDNWQTIINEFIYSTETSFSQTIVILNSIIQADQPATERGISGLAKRISDKIHFRFDGPSTPKDISGCLCSLDSRCQISADIWTGTRRLFGIPLLIQSVPGSVLACYATESLLRANMNCFYSNNIECLVNLTKAISINNTIPVKFDIKPLNSSLPTRFSQTDHISTIVYKLMIEQWSPNISYRNYFYICAPKQCNYQQIGSANVFEVITILISLYGGLSIALRLIIPHIMKLFVKKTPVEQANPPTVTHLSCLSRMRNIFSNISQLVRINIINLNIFPLRYFGNIDRDKAKRLGRFTTRLYLFLLVISLTVFALYTFIRPHITTETIENPSMIDYQQLLARSSDDQSKIDCTCATVSIPYKNFLKIEPSFHQICSSNFVSYEWQQALLRKIPIKTYEINDYRRFISAHLQLLSALCQVSIDEVNNAILSFSLSHFVNARLLLETVFNLQVNASIYTTQTRIPGTLVRQLMLTREMIHGNKIVSVYETNYQYSIVSPLWDIPLAQPMIYNDSCSCDLQKNCTSTTMFKGLYMGCVPSESLFASTLECFFDYQCLTLMKKQLLNTNNTNVTMQTLDLSLPSQYSWNTTTVDDLIKQLFVETWTTSKNYSSYFDQCSPSQCTYTYVRQANLFYSITALIGLSGGLVFILKWWCPFLIKLAWNIFRRRCNNVVASENLEE